MPPQLGTSSIRAPQGKGSRGIREIIKKRRGSQEVIAASGSAGFTGYGEYAAPPRPAYEPARISDPSYVRIFDTTLRDGEQSPGAALTAKEKLAVARNLSKLRADVIEAGFPKASPDDLNAVRQVAEAVGREQAADGYVPVICGLARASESDVEAAWSAVGNALRPRIHTFIATSKVHMEHKLKKSPEEVIQHACNAVKHARSLGCTDIEFSAEDSGRSEPAFLRDILAAVIESGATTLNIPDTVGWCLPHEFRSLIDSLRSEVSGAEDVVWSVHCQNDLGLASANSIAGALGGARQIECTINGIGERAGNASLEEVALALILRGHSEVGGNLWCGIEPKHIAQTSSMVSEFTGMSVQPHKAIVGANAFAHESGIHQDGMLKNRSTYEIVDPAVVGITRGSNEAGIVLGKHSGRHAVRTKLDEMGYELNEAEVDGVFERFKDLAQQRSGGVSDEDISALVYDSVYQPDSVWELVELTVTCGTMSLPAASVQLKGPDGLHRYATASGTGPVDAAYKAVDEIVRAQAQLVEYNISAVTEGIEALATTRVTIRPVDSQTRYSASGSSADVVRASVRAYISALNKLIARSTVRSAEAEEVDNAMDAGSLSMSAHTSAAGSASGGC